jgi:peptide deformylase
MALLSVIKYGHPTLRKVAEPFKPEEVDEKFIDDMLETMYKEDGVGLAATQVDVDKRLIVCTDRENAFVLFNPKIVGHSEMVKIDFEGCLSLPGLNAKVPRHEKVVVKAYDRDWRPMEITARGLFAVVLQHEIDHLNGILYIDRADLSTLTWTAAEIVDESLREKKTTIPEIKKVFSGKYHQNVDKIQFEK